MIYSFEPSQDYNGYSKPWAPGAGVNLWPDTLPSNAIAAQFGSGGVITSASNARIFAIPVKTNTKYQLQQNRKDAGWTGVGLSNKLPEIGDTINYLGNMTNRYNWNIDTGAYAYLLICVSSVTRFRDLVSKYQALVAESATSVPYSPYANICPVKGYECMPGDPDYNVYSGYVDSNTGMLYTRPYYSEYNGEELVGPWMSSMELYTEDGTPTTGAFVAEMGGELIEVELPKFMLQTLLNSLGITPNFGSRTLLLNSLMDQATGRVREEPDDNNRNIKIIGDQLPRDLIIKPGIFPVKIIKGGISKWV